MCWGGFEPPLPPFFQADPKTAPPPTQQRVRAPHANCLSWREKGGGTLITLHHLENSQSIRILWLLEELGLEYEFKMYDRDEATFLAPAEYKKISPLGTAPVISDGSLVLSETNAIVDYILDLYGKDQLRPVQGTPQRVRYLFWFHTAQGSLQPLLTTHFLFNAMKTRSPFFVRPLIKAIIGQAEKLFLRPRLDAIFGLIDEELSRSTWFAGDELTAADIVMGYCMEMAAARVGFSKDQVNAKRFVEQMHSRPAYQRALKKDGKFDPLAG